MKIFLGSDHAGFHLKEKVRRWLVSRGGVTVVDCGNAVFDPKDDYPDFMEKVARGLVEERRFNKNSFGIVFGYSGTGEAICVNRFKGVRACVLYAPGYVLRDEQEYGLMSDDKFGYIKLARMHNDANVLSVGAGFVNFNFVKSAIRAFIGEDFSGDERHARRIAKLDGVGEGVGGFENEIVSGIAKKNDKIIPAVMPSVYDEIAMLADSVKDYVEFVQIDVVDGVASPVKTWPYAEYSGEGGVSFKDEDFDRLASGDAELPYANELDYELDLMVYAPEYVLERFGRIGAKRIVLHGDFVQDWKFLKNAIGRMRAEWGVEFGVSFSNDFNFEGLAHSEVELREYFDYFQVMGIKNIGRQGEPFDPASLSTLLFVKNHLSGMPVQVDGSVNPMTIRRFAEHGADRFVVGSFIKSSFSVEGAIEDLSGNL